MIGRVYRINVNENDFYIGSTTITLEKRETKHNVDLRRNVKFKLYEECRKNNITKISCTLIEEIEIKEIIEIRMLEQEYITKLQPTLNSQSAYRSEEDKKEYYEKNKDKILERQKEYRENNEEWRQYHKQYHKQYYYENKEYHKEYYKEYYYENKDKLLERQGEKIKCPICNKIVRRDSLIRHKKTMKCRSSVECFIQDE